MAGSPQHATLVADTVTTLTMTGPGADTDSFDLVRVINVDGAAAVYYTVDGTTPVVAATGTHVVPAGVGAHDDVDPGGNAPVVARISTGTPKVSVEAR